MDKKLCQKEMASKNCDARMRKGLSLLAIQSVIVTFCMGGSTCYNPESKFDFVIHFV